MSDSLKMSQAAQKRLGLPPDLQFWTTTPFGGMNQQDARTAIADQEAFWLENIILLGKARYRALYDAGPARYTAPGGKTILHFFPFIVAHTPHHLVFFTDGTAVDVNQDDGTSVVVSNVPGTFYAPAVFPHGGEVIPPTCVQWGSQYLLIANNHVADAYWAWDGTLLYGAGTITPTVTVTAGGSGYSATPSIALAGGSGSGAAFSAVVVSGIIIAISVTSPGSGYVAGDAPTVVITDGTGALATATVTVMPFGISGNTMESFDTRVWLAYPHEVTVETGGIFNVSAPGSFSDFSSASGGLTFTSTDRYLRSKYNLLRQTNGYLYPFGDSSVSIVSNVQTGGVPTVTTLSYQGTDPQIGIAWRDSAQDFSRTILYANPTGIYGLYGGAVRRISGKLNDIFDNAVFPPTAGALTPSAAVVSLHTIRCYLLLLTINDPVTLQRRNVMLGWDESQWFVASQTPNLIQIASQEVNSELQAWGTDGRSIYPLFTTPSALLKTYSTKLFGAERDFSLKEAWAVYLRVQDRSTPAAGVEFVGLMEASGQAPQANPPAGIYSQPPTGSTNAFFPVQPVIAPAGAPVTTYPVWAGRSPDVFGTAIGLVLVSNSPDFEIASLTVAYTETTAIGI